MPMLRLVPEEVIHFPWQRINPGNLSFQIGSLESHPEDGHSPGLAGLAQRSKICDSMQRGQIPREGRLQSNDGFLGRQEQFVSAAMRNITDFACCLSLVFFKAQR